MNKTDLHSSLLFLMLKLEEAKSNPMIDKNFIVALTEVLRYFRDNGELKKAYESKKDNESKATEEKEQSLVSCNKSSLLEDETQFDAYT